jgi:DNA-binding NarL/FixJ family response regulator
MGLAGINLKTAELTHLTLTQREREIIECILQGYDKKKISEKLFLSFHTVNTHYKNIYLKLQIHSLSELVLKVFENGNN